MLQVVIISSMRILCGRLGAYIGWTVSGHWLQEFIAGA